MFTGLNVFKMSYAMAVHAGQRQAIVAQNVANANTPGYRTRDIESFAKLYQGGDAPGMRVSRAGHLNASASPESSWPVITPDAPTDPNGNSVSVELEMLKAVEVKRQQDRALAIYRSSLNILRTSIGSA